MLFLNLLSDALIPRNWYRVKNYPHKGPIIKIITSIFIFAARRRSIYPVFMHLFHRFHRFRRSEALFQHEEDGQPLCCPLN